MSALIKTASFSAQLRERAIDVKNKRLLISRLEGSDQEKDISEPINCGGFGRIRHFKQTTSEEWPENPLPMIPATTALKKPQEDIARAQVFQNAACNWRCWYCYVPYNLLAADESLGSWLTAQDLVNAYKALENRPYILDLSGGSPDLVPEWVLWMMDALDEADLSREVYLWSDDNLSTEYLFECLRPDEIERITKFKNYGRVCCFKGIDEVSFSFNTNAHKDGWKRQFKIAKRLIDSGIDLYGYVTLTAPDEVDIHKSMSQFFDLLQDVNEFFPLRTIPLEIKPFAPTEARMNPSHINAIANQTEAIAAWNHEIESRFKEDVIPNSISAVPLFRGKEAT